jgi:uncharacterized membrane protein
MNRSLLLLGGLAVLAMTIFAALVPFGMSLAGWQLTGHGYSAVFLMVFFCFIVGGGLMFLIFYSARQGYDDAAHRGESDRREEYRVDAGAERR